MLYNHVLNDVVKNIILENLSEKDKIILNIKKVTNLVIEFVEDSFSLPMVYVVNSIPRELIGKSNQEGHKVLDIKEVGFIVRVSKGFIKHEVDVKLNDIFQQRHNVLEIIDR